MAKETIDTGVAGAKVHVRPTADATGKSQVAVLGIDGSDNAVPASDRGIVTDPVATGWTTGTKVLAASGTAEQLQVGSLPCKAVAVFPLPLNTDRVVLGESASIVTADATMRGVPVEPGTNAVISINNVNKIYARAKVSGEGVTWIALT